MKLMTRLLHNLRGWLALSLLLAFGFQVAQAQAATWLDKLVQAERSTNVIAVETTVLVRNQQRHEVTARLLRAPGNRYRLEYLSPPSMAGQLLISDGTRAYRFLPQQHIVMVLKPTPGPLHWARNDLLKHKELVLKNFSFVKGPEGVLGGRPCIQLTIVPKHYRLPIRTLWLDKQKLIELKRVVDLGDGARLETQLSEVEFPPLLPKGLFKFVPPPNARVIHKPLPPALDSPEALQRLVQFRLLLPSPPPKGFVFDSAALIGGRGNPAAWLRYTDGLGLLSIFERPPHRGRGFSPPALAGLPVAGMNLAYGRVGSVDLLLAGELPQSVLQQVLKTLK